MATSDVTETVLTGDVTVRPAYFDHQFLRADDFNDQLAYIQDRRWRHNRDFHLKGVVGATGLALAYDGGRKALSVSEGWAVDELGRELILPAATFVPVTGAGDVWISWNEATARTSTDPGVAGTPDRITETPQITIGAKPDHAVQLGTLVAAGGGGFNVDLTHRQQVGEYIGTNDLANAAVTAPKIAQNAVIDGKLDGDPTEPGDDGRRPVGTQNIKSGAVTSRTIAANAVIAGKIGAGAVLDGALDSSPTDDAHRPVSENTIKSNAVVSRTIAAGAVVDGKLSGDALNPGNDANRPVGTAQIKTDAVTARNILAGSVVDGKLAGDATNPGNDANRPVGTPQLKTGAVTARTLAAAAVTDGKLDGDATAQTADESHRPVATAQLKTSAVDNRVLGPLAVTQPKIAAGSVSVTEMKTSVAASGSLSLGANLSQYVFLGSVPQNTANNTIYVPSVTATNPAGLVIQVDQRFFHFGASVFFYVYFTNTTATPVTVNYSVLAISAS